jgi:CheY-like chemotaxis protein
LREASETGAFLISNWGDPPTTRAKVVTMSHFDKAMELEVEVVRRTNWGISGEQLLGRMPGMGVNLIGGANLADFRAWLSHHEDDLATHPIVMVVDDDQSHLEILSAMLKHAGMAPLALDSPFGVANAAALAQPALIVLDFMMPELDGSRLCQILKHDERTAAIPVWLHSSLGEARLQALVAQCGADGFVCKISRPSETVERIREFLCAQRRDGTNTAAKETVT